MLPTRRVKMSDTQPSKVIPVHYCDELIDHLHKKTERFEKYKSLWIVLRGVLIVLGTYCAFASVGREMFLGTAITLFVVSEIVSSLDQHRFDEELLAMLKQLQDEDPYVRRSVTEALGEIGPAEEEQSRNTTSGTNGG